MVFLAANRLRARALAPLVKEAGCGFEIDPARPEVLVVHGPSIEETMALAGLLYDRRREFKRTLEPRKPRPSPEDQLSFDR